MNDRLHESAEARREAEAEVERLRKTLIEGGKTDPKGIFDVKSRRYFDVQARLYKAYHDLTFEQRDSLVKSWLVTFLAQNHQRLVSKAHRGFRDFGRGFVNIALLDESFFCYSGLSEMDREERTDEPDAVVLMRAYDPGKSLIIRYRADMNERHRYLEIPCRREKTPKER